MTVKIQQCIGMVALAALAATGGELVVEPGGLTPRQALEKVRAAKAAGAAGAWTIRVKAGVYALKETLVFTPVDSGTKDAPVTWIGEGEKTILAGGERLTGWKDAGGGTWSAPIPRAPDGTPAYFEQLWVNGRRADRARLPNRCPANLKDEYFNEFEGSEALGVRTWEDRINGYFSGRYGHFVSYMVEYYSFRGGAHGMGTMTPVVFDRKTGEVVPEEVFFADGYQAPVAALIQAHLPEALDHDEEALASLFAADLVGPNGLYEVTKDGATWYWRPYEIGPYYLGVISVSVPWKELKPYVR